MNEPATTTPLLDGRRILFVVPPSRFDEGEFYQTWQLLADEGAWLAAATDSGTDLAIGENGASVETLRLHAVDVRNYDALILVEGAEDPADSLGRAGRAVATAVAARRTVGAFGRIGAELHALGLPVVRGSRERLSRFAAELTVRITRTPRVELPAEPAGGR